MLGASWGPAPSGGGWAVQLLCEEWPRQCPPASQGPSLSCFHWPRGVQACARLQQLLEWTRSAGFGEAGEHFFRKLSCTLNLLATPSAQLIQVGGAQRAWETHKCSGAEGRGPRVVALGSRACTPGQDPGTWLLGLRELAELFPFPSCSHLNNGP